MIDRGSALQFTVVGSEATTVVTKRVDELSVAEMLDVIQAYLGTGHGWALWNIMSALRGHDEDYRGGWKRRYTLPVRALAFPQLDDPPADWCFRSEAVETATQVLGEDDSTGEMPSIYRHGAGQHFAHHIVLAYRALRDAGRF